MDRMLTELGLSSSRKGRIEADCWDDAEGIGYLPLNRWGDRQYEPRKDRWTEANR